MISSVSDKSSIDASDDWVIMSDAMGIDHGGGGGSVPKAKIKTASVVTSSQSDTNDTGSAQDDLNKIIKIVVNGIEKECKNNGKIEKMDAYSKVLESVSSVQKSLPRNKTIHFSLNSNEIKVLIVYIIGGIGLMWISNMILGIPKENLPTVLLYWTSIMAILLGAQTIPKLFEK